MQTQPLQDRLSAIRVSVHKVEGYRKAKVSGVPLPSEMPLTSILAIYPI